ncbi:hypothetical protein TeGR_g9875 [Tetraparma gracilis]|uniref:Uncharacterized protein n=1 Tax=Tetraparma gracilis TaxID=2962635 RepID=A0ABQ6MFU1_9STRA|nr:hypothetical protein TeGR_g9875 [Tetraparma gracilis]
MPALRPASEMLSTAAKASYKSVREDKSVSNARQRARKFGAERVNALAQGLCTPLNAATKRYGSVLRGLHPFEKVVADLSVKTRVKRDGVALGDILNDLNDARKQVLSESKDMCVRIKAAPTARESLELFEQLEAELKERYLSLASPPVQKLMGLQKDLRSAPSIRLDAPACVLVGSPNVGKSSIVTAISSGTPEINNYPFTTRGMTLGHVSKAFGGGRYTQQAQIMDSPGLLNRPDGERNEMEALTMASLKHLPTAVVYVMDLSGQSGDACSSIEDQLALREETRGRFPKRPWVDVMAKFDLGVDEEVMERARAVCGSDTIVEVSVHTGQGMEELKGEVDRILEEVRSVLDVIDARRVQEEEEKAELENAS